MATETVWKSEKDQEELNELKCSLQKYRDLILPLSKVLEWEQNHYPAILIGIITIEFALIWYLDPSVLTTVCMLGILLSLADFAVPTVLSHLFSGAEWTAVQENHYEEICRRLVHAKRHAINTKNWLLDLKTNKPRMYLMVMLGVFGLTAWFGSLIDNLLLTYLIVVVVSLLPGLRKHGILQQAVGRVRELISGLRKPKTI